MCFHHYESESERDFLVAQTVKHLPTMWETQVGSLGQEDLLERETATHFSILAWKTHGQRSLVGYSPWGRRVRHDWPTVNLAELVT